MKQYRGSLLAYAFIGILSSLPFFAFYAVIIVVAVYSGPRKLDHDFESNPW